MSAPAPGWAGPDARSTSASRRNGAELVLDLIGALHAEAASEQPALTAIVEWGLRRLPGVASVRLTGDQVGTAEATDGSVLSIPVTFARRRYGTLCLVLVDAARADATAKLAESVARTLGVLLDNQEEQRRRLESERNLERAMSRIVHDFRSSLTSVMGFTQLVLDDSSDPLSDAQRECLTSSFEAAAVLRSGLDELSRLVRLQQEPLTLRPELVRVDEVLDAAIALFGPSPQPVRLERVIAPAVACIMADAQSLRFAFHELLRQAFAVTPAGGRVVVDCRPYANDGFECSVTDFGAPLKDGQRRTALEPFGPRRRRPERPVQASSTALAWPLVHRLVKMLGGHMTVDSDPEAGTTARFVLPAVRA